MDEAQMHDDLQDEITTLRAQLTERDAEVAQRTRERDAMAEKALRYDREVGTLTADLDTARERVRRLEEGLGELIAAVDWMLECEADVLVLKSDNTSIVATNERARALLPAPPARSEEDANG